MLVHRKVTPSSTFAGTHLCFWVEREPKELNAVPGLEHGPLNPERGAVTVRPPRLIYPI